MSQLKATITLALDPMSKTTWIAMLTGVGVANAITFRPEDVAMVDVRASAADKWRVTLYLKSVTTPFSIDGDTEATRNLIKALGLPLQIDNVAEEKL